MRAGDCLLQTLHSRIINRQTDTIQSIYTIWPWWRIHSNFPGYLKLPFVCYKWCDKWHNPLSSGGRYKKKKKYEALQTLHSPINRQTDIAKSIYTIWRWWRIQIGWQTTYPPSFQGRYKKKVWRRKCHFCVGAVGSERVNLDSDEGSGEFIQGQAWQLTCLFPVGDSGDYKDKFW